jgi:hypothetical protein
MKDRLCIRAGLRAIFAAACVWFLFASSAYAQQVTGKSYTTFIYSDLVEEPSTEMSFQENGSLHIDAYSGVGLYAAAGPVFAGTFSAPNFTETEDLFLMIAGAVVTDFIGGVGLAFVDGAIRDQFVFFGYAR